MIPEDFPPSVITPSLAAAQTLDTTKALAHRHVSVITPSLAAAQTVSARKKVQVLMPGGFPHHSNRSLLIDDAAQLSRYHADIAFISCRSLQIPGVPFEHSQTMTTTKRALASIAAKKDYPGQLFQMECQLYLQLYPAGRPGCHHHRQQGAAENMEKARKLGKEIVIV